MTLRWEYVTHDAVEPGANWTLHNVALFHYHNPRGLYAQKVASDKRISDAVAAGRCKSGAILAHGTFNDLSVNRLVDIVMHSRVVRTHLRTHLRTQLSVTLSCIAQDIQQADRFLSSLGVLDSVPASHVRKGQG